MTPKKEQELANLRARVKELESENTLLTERAETLVLLGAMRRAFEQAENLEDALGRMSELCVALAGVETTCVMLHESSRGGWPQPLHSHCGGGDDGPCPVFSQLWKNSDLGEAGSAHIIAEPRLLAGCRLHPKASIAAPFERPTLGPGVMLFGGDHDPETWAAQAPRFEELSAMLADLMEARALRDALEHANETLEAKVEERTAELDLDRSRLATILDCAAGGIVETAVDGRILSANQAFAQMLGYAKDELEAKTWMELTHPDDVTSSRHEVERLSRGEIASYSVDKRYIRKDGSHFEGQVRISVTRDPDGKPERHIAVIRDLTREREAQRSLRRLNHAVEQSRDAIVLTDADGRIQYVNAAFARGSGYSLDEVRGKTPRVLKSGTQSDAFYRRLWSTIVSGKTWQGRFVNKRKDGSLYTEESTISPVFDEQHEIEGYVAVKRDLTERLALEEQLRQSQKLEAIGQLAGGIAHDFNNLLMPVLVDGEMLTEELAMEDPRRELAQEILEAAERAKDLTRQLLAFSRKQMLDINELDLAQVVLKFGRVLERILREDVQIVFETGDAPTPTEADMGQIEQVLMNLVVNAQDAMPMGGELLIRVLPNADPPEGIEGPGWVAFEVRDTGTGMAPETLRRATEPFFTTKDRGKGTGLGLSTCHGIAKQHGGGLRIVSAPGEGTCVRVTLPRLESSEGRPETPTRATSTRPRSTLLRGQAVWLVEDDDAVASSTARLLRAAGAEVLRFSTALELLDQLPTLKPAQVLLTDVILPGMDGRALHERLRQHLPDLPVVYFSGYPDEVLAPHGVLVENVHFVQKPFTSERLLRELEAALFEAEEALLSVASSPER
ncbi:MAG: PAS domain S-box protein [Deltaproteobacteria bacterium]|nr:PAS domain S-box protein [Deltaproteobacteria bacterium]